LGLLCLNSTAPAEELAAAAELAESAAARLGGSSTASSSEAYRDGSYFTDPRVFADRGAMTGQSHPTAPPLRLEWDGKRVTATATFDELHEGVPGVVHGGLVAAAFDQVLGFAPIALGKPGLTTKLEVTYVAPHPIRQSLVFEAELSEEDARFCTVTGHSRMGDTILARAVGRFRRISQEKISTLILGKQNVS
jgi:acyl-coenzyme A thioesterase PaaI-like protein